jgi:hypothetical protein
MGWSAELDPPATQVAVGRAEGALGVVSYGGRPEDGTGLLLWLSCYEDPATAEVLIVHAHPALPPSLLGDVDKTAASVDVH